MPLIFLGTSILSYCNRKHVEDFMTSSMHNLSIKIDMIRVDSTVQYSRFRYGYYVSIGKKEIAKLSAM